MTEKKYMEGKQRWSKRQSKLRRSLRVQPGKRLPPRQGSPQEPQQTI